jgi:hypothetical protein
MLYDQRLNLHVPSSVIEGSGASRFCGNPHLWQRQPSRNPRRSLITETEPVDYFRGPWILRGSTFA